MSSSLPRDITRKEYDEYHQNSVVLLPDMFGADPGHSAFMTEYGLKPRDRPGTDLYPGIWSQ